MLAKSALHANVLFLLLGISSSRLRDLAVAPEGFSASSQRSVTNILLPFPYGGLSAQFSMLTSSFNRYCVLYTVFELLYSENSSTCDYMNIYDDDYGYGGNDIEGVTFDNSSLQAVDTDSMQVDDSTSLPSLFNYNTGL